ncbi:MAG: GatB/YqeY domain-containing protein [Gammaproteobacteria bacterium]|nr:GatB/YqeY domain-containing protein [Gammaproteobacteria bacterium]
MTSELKARITEDMKLAMRAQDKERLGTIRLLLAAIKQREVDERVELTDADIQDVITKMIKQRKDSIEQFKAANREDLASQEAAEIHHIKQYLPEALSESEIYRMIDETIHSVGKEIKNMGKIMAELKAKMHGRADMTQVSQWVKSKLG